MVFANCPCAQRDQLKQKERFAGATTVKRVDDALDDLDDLMGDLNASRFGSMTPTKKVQKDPVRFVGTVTVAKRVDEAVGDLDDLMGDMNKSRARRVRPSAPTAQHSITTQHNTAPHNTTQRSTQHRSCTARSVAQHK